VPIRKKDASEASYNKTKEKKGRQKDLSRRKTRPHLLKEGKPTLGQHGVPPYKPMTPERVIDSPESGARKERTQLGKKKGNVKNSSPTIFTATGH